MKSALILLSAITITIVTVACASRNSHGQSPKPHGENHDEIYQVSTFGGLTAGALEGTVTYAALMRKGDFGIGTFSGLDGEMWALDGRYYQILADGTARPVDPQWEAPFATLKFFAPDMEFEFEKELACTDLYKTIDSQLPTLNVPYAFRIEGKFAWVRTRSVARKEKPYPSLEEIIRSQVEQEFGGSGPVNGTLVGYRFPKYLGGVNLAGYHLHFLNDTRTLGGHLLDCRVLDVAVAADRASGVRISLPKTGEFDRVSLGEQP